MAVLYLRITNFGDLLKVNAAEAVSLYNNFIKAVAGVNGAGV